MTQEELRKLLMELGNVNFLCGEFPADQVVSEEYAALAKRAFEIQDEILTAFACK